MSKLIHLFTVVLSLHYSILYTVPVYFSLVGTEGPVEAFNISYKVALAANFITGT
jgi:hypothetical protein